MAFNIQQYKPGMTLDEGIFVGVPDEVYFAHDALSNSDMKNFNVSPAHYRYGERVETKAQAFGKLGHCAILEPDQLDARFLPSDASRVGTKEWQADEARAAGRQVVKRAEYAEALRMRNTVLGRPGVLRDLVKHPDTLLEFAFFWTDPATGVKCRGKADGALLQHGVAFDIKTTDDARADSFSRSVRDYRYHWQREFYSAGLAVLGAPIDDFLFIPIEKTYPFQYRAWPLPGFLIEKARAGIANTLERYAQCLKDDDWPGYPLAVETLPYPEAWATFHD